MRCESVEDLLYHWRTAFRMSRRQPHRRCGRSRPAGSRELKQMLIDFYKKYVGSRPAGSRELKLTIGALAISLSASRPAGSRELKQIDSAPEDGRIMSRPAGSRELKLPCSRY